MAVLLKVADPSSSLFAVHRPNTGRQSQSEKLKVLQKKYSKVEDEEEAEKWWAMQYQSSLSVCSHAFWSVSQSVCMSVYPSVSVCLSVFKAVEWLNLGES